MTASGSPMAPAGPPAPGYPAARRAELAEDLQGRRVPDPYRWLEDAAGSETQEWLLAQDTLWAGAEAGLSGRTRLAARLQELMAAGYVGAPVWRGPRQFFMRRLPGQEHGVLLTAAPGEPERVLVDPAALDPAGLTTLDSWPPDQEGRLLAYQLSSGGDEESQLRVLDVVSGEPVDGPIGRCRYSPVAWLPGGKEFFTSASSRQVRSRRAKSSFTGGCTCTRWARPPTRTCWSSARAGTRRTTTASRSAGTAAGWSSRPPRAPPPATTCGWPT